MPTGVASGAGAGDTSGAAVVSLSPEVPSAGEVSASSDVLGTLVSAGTSVVTVGSFAGVSDVREGVSGPSTGASLLTFWPFVVSATGGMASGFDTVVGLVV